MNSHEEDIQVIEVLAKAIRFATAFGIIEGLNHHYQRFEGSALVCSLLVFSWSLIVYVIKRLIQDSLLDESKKDDDPTLERSKMKMVRDWIRRHTASIIMSLTMFLCLEKVILKSPSVYSLHPE